MKRKVAAGIVTAVAALAMTASPAQAHSGTGAVTTTDAPEAPLAGENFCTHLYIEGEYAGEGCFYHAGDRIWVKDHRADGLRVVVEARYNYDRRNDECDMDQGAGVGGFCNYNMREDKKVSIRVLARNGANGPDLYTTHWTPFHNIG
ncbi:hypothetical protein ACWF94_02405 [Streptomyces sp. NPDC055078]